LFKIIGKTFESNCIKTKKNPEWEVNFLAYLDRLKELMQSEILEVEIRYAIGDVIAFNSWNDYESGRTIHSVTFASEVMVSTMGPHNNFVDEIGSLTDDESRPSSTSVEEASSHSLEEAYAKIESLRKLHTSKFISDEEFELNRLKILKAHGLNVMENTLATKEPFSLFSKIQHFFN
jgi:hypothetical protein